MTSLTQTYFELLAEAQEASEAEDDFDLHSDDPLSTANFAAIQARALCAHYRLMNFAAANRDALLVELAALPVTERAA